MLAPSIPDPSGWTPGLLRTIVGYPVRVAIGSPYFSTCAGNMAQPGEPTITTFPLREGERLMELSDGMKITHG